MRGGDCFGKYTRAGATVLGIWTGLLNHGVLSSMAHKNRHKQIPATKLIGKHGSPYERVVADVMRAMEPGARVTQGDWVQGPDGRRDRDVFVEGALEGTPVRLLIECKDFNPVSTGSVGIAFVDALESKRRDVSCTATLICSNAGFTDGAVRKASRVGIGLIAVMRSGDARVRYVVRDTVYTRKIRVTALRVDIAGPHGRDISAISPSDIYFDNLPLQNWLIQKAMLVLTNPVVEGDLSWSLPLLRSITLQSPVGPIETTRLSVILSITGGWFMHDVALDATNAVYDWIRHRVRRAPGSGRFMIRDIDLDGGVPTTMPPEREPHAHKDLLRGEVSMSLMLIEGLPAPGPIPPIDQHIDPKELEDWMIADTSLAMPQEEPANNT